MDNALFEGEEGAPIGAQRLLLALYSGILPGGAQGPYEVPEIEIWFAACKIRALPKVLDNTSQFVSLDMKTHRNIKIRVYEDGILKKFLF